MIYFLYVLYCFRDTELEAQVNTSHDHEIKVLLFSTLVVVHMHRDWQPKAAPILFIAVKPERRVLLKIVRLTVS